MYGSKFSNSDSALEKEIFDYFVDGIHNLIDNSDLFLDIYNKYDSILAEDMNEPWDLAFEEDDYIEKLADVYTRMILFNIPSDKQ
jgi:hypothetical protein